MQIADLKVGMRRVDVEGVITAIESAREVQTKFGPSQVANATLTDGSGSVTISLWDDQIEKFGAEDQIKIMNGYMTSFRGDLQLNVGRYGKIETVAPVKTTKKVVKK